MNARMLFERTKLSLCTTLIAFALAGCAKSGTTFDEDFARAKDPSPDDGESGSGAGAGGNGQGSGQAARGGGDPVCGNGTIDGGEECDGVLLGGATCQSLGFDGGGALICDPQTCSYDESMCRLQNVNSSGGNSGNGGGGGSGPRGGTGG